MVDSVVTWTSFHLKIKINGITIAFMIIHRIFTSHLLPTHPIFLNIFHRTKF